MGNLNELLPDIGEQLTLVDHLVEDDDVVLDGSNAEYGFRAGDLEIEVFDEDRLRPHTYVTIYPLDGRDQPTEIDVIDLNFKSPSMRVIVQSGLVLRALGIS
ncbi:MAG TPA: hypothetical protein VLE69_00685 [Candidatus Saccharimonadales bacterium]|nr:hypothetical protein [Candidatus Saccharimonadales bacterium]